MAPIKQRAFLAAYAQAGNISAAARLAKCARSQHYEWLEDPTYAKAFETARQEYGDLLESELHRRVFEGIEEPVIYQGQLQYKVDSLGRRTRRPLTIRKFTDVTLLAALNANLPLKYRQNVKTEISGSLDLVERLQAGRKRLQEAEQP